MKIHQTLAYGCPMVIEALWERLRLKKVLSDICSLEAELESHRDHRATAQWAIELLASRRFKRYLRITKGGQVCIDRAAIQNAAKYHGKWVIETNYDTISLEDAACGCKGLMVFERCFRSLKRSQIKMMPMYHWASRRIESYVEIFVPAAIPRPGKW